MLPGQSTSKSVVCTSGNPYLGITNIYAETPGNTITIITNIIPPILVLPDNKPKTGQPVGNKDEAGNKEAEDEGTVLGEPYTIISYDFHGISVLLQH